MEIRGLVQSVMAVSILTMLLCIAPAALAENGQREGAESVGKSGWLLDVNTQNWTCNVFAGKTAIGNGSGVGQCKARTGVNGEYRQHLAYAYAQPVKVWDGAANKYYFYVEEWGAVEGPGSECSGDSVMIFEVPYSANGALAAGGVKPIYRGTANPCNTGVPHWLFDTAMYDELTGGVTLTGQRNVQDTIEAGAFREIWIAESKPAGDGSYGKNFVWKKLFGTAVAGHALLHLYVVPDAGGKIWRGFIENKYPGVNGAWGATPITINRAQGTYRYKTGPGLNDWTDMAAGSSMTVLPYIDPTYFTHFIHSFVKVNNRYELWFEKGAPRSGVKPMQPCNQAMYTFNVETPANGGALGRDGANDPYYLVVDVNLNPISVKLPLHSDTHPIPSDERFSAAATRAMNMVNLPGSTTYYGSNDWAVCNIYLTNWGHWSGSGIRWGRLTTE